MFDSLFKVKISWAIFFGIAITILIAFPGLSLLEFLGFVITLHQFFLLFYSLNYVIPIRYLFGAFMCLQMFIGPIFAYGGLDKYIPVAYQMKVPRDVYFEYVVPAVLCFIIGLNITANKLQGEIIQQQQIKKYTDQYPNLSYYLIGAGFFASLSSDYFPASIAFVLYLLGSFKFIGAFLLVISGKKLKVFPLILVWGSIISSSLGNGMFHDLLTWLIILGAFFAVKYKFSTWIKVIGCISFILLSVIIQQLKATYRSAISANNREAGLSTFSEVYAESNSKNQLFDYGTLAVSNIRINQGFIITNIMKTVPDAVPFAEGEELKEILISAFLPRILAPDKLSAGDKELFTKYSGIKLSANTSMGLSSVGDAYVNFGVAGGCVFMFFLGLLYNIVLKGFYNYSKHYPLLLVFVPLVFYYPIRPDCELQTILGHLVKSCFLIFLFFSIWKRQFFMKPVNNKLKLEPVIH